jgi:hypothetical protein
MKIKKLINWFNMVSSFFMYPTTKQGKEVKHKKIQEYYTKKYRES